MDQDFRAGQEKKAGLTGVTAAFSFIVICVLLVILLSVTSEEF